MREARNCDGQHPSETLYFPWAPELKRCPFSAISEEAWQWIDAWGESRTLKVLPERGDLGDQPAHVFQAFAACERAVSEAEARERRKVQAEQKAVTEHTKRGGRR